MGMDNENYEVRVLDTIIMALKLDKSITHRVRIEYQTEYPGLSIYIYDVKGIMTDDFTTIGYVGQPTFDEVEEKLADYLYGNGG